MTLPQVFIQVAVLDLFPAARAGIMAPDPELDKAAISVRSGADMRTHPYFFFGFGLKAQSGCQLFSPLAMSISQYLPARSCAKSTLQKS